MAREKARNTLEGKKARNTRDGKKARNRIV